MSIAGACFRRSASPPRCEYRIDGTIAGSKKRGSRVALTRENGRGGSVYRVKKGREEIKFLPEILSKVYVRTANPRIYTEFLLYLIEYVDAT